MLILPAEDQLDEKMQFFEARALRHDYSPPNRRIGDTLKFYEKLEGHVVEVFWGSSSKQAIQESISKIP